MNSQFAGKEGGGRKGVGREGGRAGRCCWREGGRAEASLAERESPGKATCFPGRSLPIGLRSGKKENPTE